MYRVAIAFPYTDAANNQLYRGIKAYAQQHPIFEFRFFANSEKAGLKELLAWKGDGAIVGLRSKEAFQQVKDTNLALVNVSGAINDASVPRVCRDQEQIGIEAANHLSGLGVKHLAFAASGNRHYSQLRWRAFQKVAEELGHPVTSCFLGEMTGPAKEEEMIREFRYWLKGLKPPVGLLLDRDVLYDFVYQACIQGGFRIPEDIAIIGVNNMQACAYHEVPLTSFQFNNPQFGIRVMETLHALIEDRAKPEALDVSLPGIELIERESSDVLHCDDPGLSQAIRYIKANADKPFAVEDLLEQAKCSRRTLENAIKRELDCTLHNFVAKERIKRVKSMLKTYRFLDPDVFASMAGFSSARHLRDVFQKHEGCSFEEMAAKDRKDHLHISASSD